MSHIYELNSRNPVIYFKDKIKEVLPEYFTESYPNLVSFLEKYYETLEEDDKGFSYLLQGLYQIRDLDTTLLSTLDNIFLEFSSNKVSSKFFSNPREAAKLIGFFYKHKGSKLSADMFFKLFFNEDVEVVYPKKDIFIVGESRIGPLYEKYIQNDERYQVFSILIRSALPRSNWDTLYKSLVHPAGFYLAGDVAIESVITLNIEGIQQPLVASEILPPVFQSVVDNTANYAVADANTYIVIDDADSDQFAERYSIHTTLGSLGNATLSELTNNYGAWAVMADPNSPTFDDDNTADTDNRDIDFSNVIETMDKQRYDQYDGINNVYQYQDSA